MPDQKVIGDFVMLPESTLLSKQWKNFTPSTRIVFATMMLRYKRKGDDANGHVRWKQQELSDMAGLTRRTVINCIQDLVNAKWIHVEELGNKWGEGTEYYIEPEWANGKG